MEVLWVRSGPSYGVGDMFNITKRMIADKYDVLLWTIVIACASSVSETASKLDSFASSLYSSGINKA